MELVFILFLIIVNGIFSMSEIAIVSARKSKLQQKAAEGSKSAQTALELAREPNRFLSTVQIGITLIGILTGAFGEATLTNHLSLFFQEISFMAPFSDFLALTIVVVIITYFSLVIGEIVPKRIALSSPEKIASYIALPMNFLSKIASPIVKFLSISTEFVLRLLQIKNREEEPVSEEEINLLIREGEKVGVFEKEEKDIVERTLKLGDKKARTLMTSRKEIVWIDIDSSLKTIRNKLLKFPHSHYPVCQGKLDHVTGVARREDILTDFLVDEKVDIQKSLLKPLLIPENTDGLKVLELFKKTGVHMAIVIDEYGSVKGLVTLNNILEAIVGDIPTANQDAEDEIVKRDDGTYLVDGLLSIDKLKDHFHIKKLPGEKTGMYHTAGGFVMSKLGKIPKAGDFFTIDNLKIEVVDMDANRVDKLLIAIQN